MSKIASAKQTGQGGTSYEDKTNAFFLACMLTGRPPFGADYGIILGIKFQVRADGWMFDDSLLNMDKAGSTFHIANSIKSAAQFTREGASAEIVRLLWEQYLGVENKVFNTANDYLCLVQSPPSASVSTSLNTVLRQAAEQEPDELYARNQIDGYNSADKRKLFSSFSCPSDLAASHQVAPSSIGAVLRRYINLEFDFEKQVSTSEQRAHEICSAALADKKPEAATALFKRLCQVAREMSSVSGSVDRAKLVGILKSGFVLESFPVFASDWKKIKEDTIGKLMLISDRIGGKFQLLRDKNIEELNDAFAASYVVLLTGISGGGKTAVAKAFANQTIGGNNPVIWINGGDSQNELLHIKLGLTHTITELVQNGIERNGCIIVDGIDKLGITARNWLMPIIHLGMNAHWKILLTFPLDTSDYVNKILHENNLQPSAYAKLSLPPMNDTEITELVKYFPGLTRFFVSDSMRTILSNLKLLDSILINTANLDEISESELGETQLIDFIWKHQVESLEQGLQRSAFLKSFSEKQADKLSLQISTTEFTISEIAPAENLVRDHFLLQKEEHFSFVHDLYGDWSRYKLLLSKREQIKSFLSLKHLSSPLWARAVRLWGISLLEKNESIEEWKKQFEQFADGSAHDKTVQDLLLESFIFAGDSYQLLSRNKELLFAANGELMKRLLELFLIRATMANPEIMQLANSMNMSEATALKVDRLPIFYYWFDFLHFLSDHSQTLVGIDFVQTASIAATWIRHTPKGFLLRKEATGIICTVAERILRNQTGSYVNTETEQPIYEALLMGYADNPEEIKTLSLQIAKRLPLAPGPFDEPKEEQSDLTSETKSDGKKPVGRLAPFIRMSEPWPDGPIERVDEGFQNACLQFRSIAAIMLDAPELATELLLASIIDEPKDSFWQGGMHDTDYCIYTPHSWYPPFYMRGPFLNFFHLQPIHAIRFMNRLIDFVTERHITSLPDEESKGIMTQLNGADKYYKGNSSVLLWHKDIGNAPHIVVSLLMAFEQFLYEKMEEKKPVNEYVRLAISETNSLAVAGVLLVAAKKQWNLYLDELFHLLFHPELLYMDAHSHDHSYFDAWGYLPKTWHEAAKKWKERSGARYFPLKDVLVNRFVGHEDFYEKAKALTDAWEQDIASLDPRDLYVIYMKQCIAQLKMENWIWNEEEKSYAYCEPAALSEDLAGGRKQSIDTMELGSFAWMSRKKIEGDAAVSLETAEDTWQKLQGFISNLSTQSVEASETLGQWASPYTNILAAMATLMARPDAWRARHPEYWDFIKEYCASLIEKRRASEEHYDGHAAMDDWTTFMAEIAPSFWKEDTADKISRSIVAGCCILFGQAATGRLLKSIAAVMGWGEPSFIQVQNLLIEFAGVYPVRHAYEEPKESLAAVRSELMDKFIGGTMPMQALKWEQIRQPEKWISKETDYWRDRKGDTMRAPGLRTGILITLFKNIPELATVTDNNDQRQLYFLLKEGIDQLTYEFGEIKDTSSPITSYPSDYANAILQRLAQELLSIPDEIRSDYWKPLLSFGYIAQKWITNFLRYFFLYSLQSKKFEKMAEVVGEMLSFTTSLDTWSAKRISRHEDFRLALVGMQLDFVSIWTDDYTIFMEKARGTYDAWFKKNKINPFAVLSLLEFMTTTSGSFIIELGLLISNYFFRLSVASKNVPREGMVYVGHPEHDAKLGAMLNYLWKNHNARVISDQKNLVNYKDLVQYLVSINDPVGMELQEKLMVG